MRMLGLTSIVLAAGLALGGTATAQNATAPEPAPVVAPAEAPPATQAAATTPAAADAAKPADPTLNPDGTFRRTATPEVGQPTDSHIGLQPQVTPNGRIAAQFHDGILLWSMIGISVFVLILLLWVIVRYNRRANPVPSKTAHNTLLEVVWTLAPVIILVIIAVPSIGLLAKQFKPAPDNAVTLKAIGNQWFWSYEYPDHGVQLTANMLKERDDPTLAKGARFRTDNDGPRLLATDNRVVLPVGVPIRVLATAQDVIHAWAIPAFWAKIDAVPGKLNEISFTIEKEGLYFGQCSELCGARHGYMPIVVEAVSQAEFAQWVSAKGGKMPAPAPVGPMAGNDSVDDTSDTENGAGPVENAIDIPANDAAPANAAAGNTGH